MTFYIVYKLKFFCQSAVKSNETDNVVRINYFISVKKDMIK